METLTLKDNFRISSKREQIVNAFKNPEENTVAILGPCAMTFNLEHIFTENFELQEFERSLENKGVQTVHRIPFWKPRTDPIDWHGVESEHPNEALFFLNTLARFGNNISAETGLLRHIGKLSALQTFSWIGSRNFGNTDLINNLLDEEIDIPVGVKNDMSGNVSNLIDFVENINDKRFRKNPPIIPIFRGGTEIDTTKKWEESVKKMSERTKGKCIIDLAHGSEMVHDPSDQFKKTEIGQVLACIHLAELVSKGALIAGFMFETSDVQSPTDPVMPFDVGLACARILIESKL